MSGPLSVAILGFWHVHAADYARSILDHPETTLDAVWDPDAVRGREAAAGLGVEFVEDLDALLAREEIDAVTVTTATSEHHDVIGRAIAAEKHIFTEKLLAPTVEEAQDLVTAANQRGLALVVSLPRLHEGTTVTVKRLIDDGSLGTITYTRIRMAHNGWIGNWLPERFADKESAVGGALADLGCHPAYLAQHFLGPVPESVSASYGYATGRPVEDNAVVTAAYPGGALGVFEASFVTTPGAFTLEVRGTAGSLLYGFGSERLLAKGAAFDPEAWTEVPVADHEPGPFDQWVDHIRSRTTARRNLAAAVELTRMVSAANRAAETGRAIDYEQNKGIS
jgi:1,5-anhydro-D-fructose reductase (1,5-anhydro-D-mannitol-forming)